MPRVKLLVVDDSPTHLKIASRPLEEQGYEVITAADGEEALAKAGAERPDVIVLDVIMPRLNGFQVCRQIKNSPALRHIKVLLLTSKSQESDRFWGKKQGADAYMTKPFTDDQLIKAVADVLGGRAS